MRCIALLLAAILSAPAFASGGISCTARDDAVALDISGGVTRGMGGGLFSLRGKLNATDLDVAPDLADADYALEHVTQFWLDRDELNLLLYRERFADEVFGSSMLTIETRLIAGGEAEYEGRYRIDIFDGDASEGVSREGAVSCSAE